MPRFSNRSPALAHTTIAKTMTSVLILSLLSLPIVCLELIVSRCRGCPRHADHRLRGIAALANPLPALRAQLHEARRLMIQALAFMAVPQRLAHNPPRNARPEIIFVVETV